jgi:prophage regulatory protein
VRPAADKLHGVPTLFRANPYPCKGPPLFDGNRHGGPPSTTGAHTHEHGTTSTPVILRRPQVEARTGLSRSTLYQYIQDGLFPRPVSLGARAVGWLESEVTAWIAARVKAVRPGKAPGR